MAAVSLWLLGVSRLCRGVFGGVCFENFIVDASIFVDFVVVFFGKLLSAIGGCLGTKSR